MPNSTLINFSDLGSTPSVSIPNNYQGFNWLGYSIQEEFTGHPMADLNSAFTPPPARVIHGVGFQMSSNAAFDLSALSIAPNNGLGQLNITLRAFRQTNTGLEVIASFVIKTSNEHSPNVSVLSNLTLKNINQLQIFSNSMETFDVGSISIVNANAPLPPSASFK